jgi:hypothetical protein
VRAGPADEARRSPPAGQRWWAEWFSLTFGRPGTPAGVSTIVLLPAQGRAWYLAALVRPGHGLVSVVDLAQGIPMQGLRLRAGNLWVDHVCEEPLRQWTVVNETYGVALDDPDDALGRAYGDPVPVAFDLEWYATGEPIAAQPEGYAVDGRVHGAIELRDGLVELDDVPGRHEHRWGPWPFPDDPADRGVAAARAPARLESDAGAIGWEAALGPLGWSWRRRGLP